MNSKKAKDFISSNLKILFLSIAIGLFACAISIFAFSSPGSNQPPNGNPIFWLLSGTSMYYTAGNVGIGTASPAATLDVGGTGSQKIPVGTTAQRPSTPVAGMIRFNTDNTNLEFYNGSKWSIVLGDCSASGGVVTKVNGYCVHTFTTSGTFTVANAGNVEILVVAGGGGGGGSQAGYQAGGGGGAGGLVYNSSFAVTSQTYTVTVGAGGAGGIAAGSASPGSNSVFGSITAIGGGIGGTAAGSPTYGGNGGSGGGAQYYGSGQNLYGLGTSGQGYNGGASSANLAGNGAGGGGGAGGAGSSGTTSAGGNGGIGVQLSITGTPTYYAGGGGGAGVSGSTNAGSGGLGGGGAGVYNSGTGVSGTPNTGGGGGGGSFNASLNGGAGGSGIVVIRYPLGQ